MCEIFIITFIVAVVSYIVGRLQKGSDVNKYQELIHTFLTYKGWEQANTIYEELVYYAPGSKYPAHAYTQEEAMLIQAGESAKPTNLSGGDCT